MILAPANDRLYAASLDWDPDLLRTLLTGSAKATTGGWFMSWHWFDAWLRNFDGEYQKRLIVVRNVESEEIVAILPLYRARRSLRWRILGENLIACPDHLDLICFDTVRSEAAWIAILDFMATEREFECLDIDHLDGRSSLLAITSERKTLGAWALKVQPSRVCHRIDLSACGSWDGLLRTLGAKMRSNIKRGERKFREAYSVAFESLESVEERLIGLRELIELHTARWQLAGHAGAFKDERFGLMLEQLICSPDGEAGDIRLFRLSADGQAVGLLFGIVHEREFFFLVTGYDVSMKEFSPGLVLMAHVIRHVFNEQLVAFDFLRGNEWYKTQWATEAVIDQRVRVYWGAAGVCLRTYDEVRELTLRFRRQIGTYLRSLRRS